MPHKHWSIWWKIVLELGKDRLCELRIISNYTINETIALSSKRKYDTHYQIKFVQISNSLLISLNHLG